MFSTHICTGSGDVLYPLLSFRTHNSSLEGAYGAEICTILLLLRCSFRWYPCLPKSKFSDFGQKPWTIIRRFDQNRGHSLQSFYSSRPLPIAIFPPPPSSPSGVPGSRGPLCHPLGRLLPGVCGVCAGGRAVAVVAGKEAQTAAKLGRL